MIHDDNAVTVLCEAVARLGRHRFPVVMTPTVRAFLEAVSEVLGLEIDLDDPEIAISKLAAVAPIIGATLRNTANPTRLAAGYKENVIPGLATATIDCRTLPGQHDEFFAALREIIGPDLAIETIEDQPAVETTFDGPLVDAMSAALGENPAPSIAFARYPRILAV